MKGGKALEQSEALRYCFLFKGLGFEEIEALISKSTPQIEAFSRGDTIYSPSTFRKKIGLILEGRCEVRHSRSHGSGVVMNVLREGDSFGVLAAFSENEFPTEIVAAKISKVMFFDKKDIISFVESRSEIAMNLITFMVNRIEFLNEKIFTFSGGNVEQKLASYLISEAKTKGENFDFNRKKTAEAISAGRASVYRALDSFAELGILKYDSKKIYLLDLEGLERISK